MKHLESFEKAVMKMTPTDIVLMHAKSNQFSESCRLTVRDTQRDDVRDHIANALFNAMFK